MRRENGSCRENMCGKGGCEWSWALRRRRQGSRLSGFCIAGNNLRRSGGGDCVRLFFIALC